MGCRSLQTRTRADIADTLLRTSIISFSVKALLRFSQPRGSDVMALVGGDSGTTGARERGEERRAWRRRRCVDWRARLHAPRHACAFAPRQTSSVHPVGLVAVGGFAQASVLLSLELKYKTDT